MGAGEFSKQCIEISIFLHEGAREGARILRKISRPDPCSVDFGHEIPNSDLNSLVNILFGKITLGNLQKLGLVLAERIFHGFLFLSRPISSQILSPDYFSFCGKMCTENPRQNPPKFIQQNPQQLSSEGPGQRKPFLDK